MRDELDGETTIRLGVDIVGDGREWYVLPWINERSDCTKPLGPAVSRAEARLAARTLLGDMQAMLVRHMRKLAKRHGVDVTPAPPAPPETPDGSPSR